MTSRKRRSGSAFVLDDTPPPYPRAVLAIDPGAALKSHTNGMAAFSRQPHKPWTYGRAWAASTLDMLSFVEEWVQTHTGTGVLVVEEFRLYPDKMQELGFTSIAVVEVIGALRWMVAGFGEPQPVPVVMQQASIKKHGDRYMAEQGIEHHGPNQHARDAESHGWYWIGRKCR